MTKRRRAILLLLWSLDDYTPGPKTQRFVASRGLAPAERRPCPDCGHSDRPGWTVRRERGIERPPAPCVTCGGKQEPSGRHGQWLRTDGGRGWVKVDPMDSDQRPVQTVGVDALPTRPARVVNCDACQDMDGKATGVIRGQRCPYCDGTGKRTVLLVEVEAEREYGDRGLALESAIDRRDRVGSYHELEQALSALPPAWWRLVHRVHVRREIREHELPRPQQADLTAALAAVDLLMPDPIRVPAAVRHAWRLHDERAARTKAVGRGAGADRLAQRDKEIRKLARQGRPTQWVAAEYGLSVRRVNEILSGAPEAA